MLRYLPDADGQARPKLLSVELVDEIRRRVADGEFAASDPVLVKGLLGMHNYSYLWMREDGRLTPEEIADRFCDILLGGLTGVGPR